MNIVDICKTGKQDPFQLLIFKNLNFGSGLSVFLSIDHLQDNAKLAHTTKYLSKNM